MHLCSRISQFAQAYDPINKNRLVLLLSSGASAMRRIANIVSYCIITNKQLLERVRLCLSIPGNAFTTCLCRKHTLIHLLCQRLSISLFRILDQAPFLLENSHCIQIPTTLTLGFISPSLVWQYQICVITLFRRGGHRRQEIQLLWL